MGVKRVILKGRRRSLGLRLLLIGMLIFGLFFTACSSRQKAPAKELPPAAKEKRRVLYEREMSQVMVYYLTEDGNYLVPVTVPINPTREVAKVAVEKLLAGPKGEGLQAPIPGEVKLRDIYLLPDEETVFVDFTHKFMEVSDSKKAGLAVKALVLTLTEIYPIGAVQILVEGQKIAKLGDTSIDRPLKRPEVINPLGLEDIKNSKKVKVYFTDAKALRLVPVTVPAPPEAGDDMPRAAVLALIAGPPKDSHLGRTFWPGTRLLDFKVANGVAFVDLSAEAIGYGGGSTAETLLVNSLVFTLTDFPGINKVQLLLEGKKRQYLPEGTIISEPLTRPERLNF
ncbi:MAG: germination protein [Clostridia bacterium]|nr:germination protein [Clostridia bacterium]